MKTLLLGGLVEDMDERDIMGLIETLLFVSGDAIPTKRIADFLELDVRKARKLMEKLNDVVNFERRGIQIISVNDSYQLATRPEYG